jgi:hypothetical protein
MTGLHKYHTVFLLWRDTPFGIKINSMKPYCMTSSHYPTWIGALSMCLCVYLFFGYTCKTCFMHGLIWQARDSKLLQHSIVNLYFMKASKTTFPARRVSLPPHRILIFIHIHRSEISWWQCSRCLVWPLSFSKFYFRHQFQIQYLLFNGKLNPVVKLLDCWMEDNPTNQGCPNVIGKMHSI